MIGRPRRSYESGIVVEQISPINATDEVRVTSGYDNARFDRLELEDEPWILRNGVKRGRTIRTRKHVQGGR